MAFQPLIYLRLSGIFCRVLFFADQLQHFNKCSAELMSCFHISLTAASTCCLQAVLKSQFFPQVQLFQPLSSCGFKFPDMLRCSYWQLLATFRNTLMLFSSSVSCLKFNIKEIDYSNLGIDLSVDTTGVNLAAGKRGTKSNKGIRSVEKKTN